MGLPQPVKRYTPFEYYAMERVAEYKSDYYQGEIFAMAGGTTRHSRICSNVIAGLHQFLRGKPCSEYESNQRLKVMATGLRCYPDVSVYCGPLVYDLEDIEKETATNPTVLFEVLSPSTESYDRGTKARSYRQIPSLQAYVLIAQDRPHVEVFTRQGEQTWLLSEETNLSNSVDFPSIGVALPLAEIYDRVDFDSPPELFASSASA
jgi:Uma2 family endonuclease